ncbi:hypothetical protein ACJX0J_001005 (mitochondrion) [Zea mays]
MSFFQSFYLWASNYTAISIQPWTHGYTKKVEVTAFLPWIGIRKEKEGLLVEKIEISLLIGIHKVTSLHFTSNESEFEELTDLVDEGDPPNTRSNLVLLLPRAKGPACKRVEAIGR